VAFAVHARVRGTKKRGGTNPIVYPFSLLFILCTIFCAIDTAQTLFILRYEGTNDPQIGLASYNLNIANTSMYCAITLIAQGILIYRCWRMWNRNWFIISVPLFLAWASFGTSLAMLGALIEPPELRVPDKAQGWIIPVGTAAFSSSIAVNAMVSTLLAIKIISAYHKHQQALIVQKRKITSFRLITIILNDSGVLMLGCQIIWLVLFLRHHPAFFLVRGPIVMIYGLTPTLIRKRVSEITQASQTSVNEKPKTGRNPTIRFA